MSLWYSMYRTMFNKYLINSQIRFQLHIIDTIAKTVIISIDIAAR
jgi:hypothetical protein